MLCSLKMSRATKKFKWIIEVKLKTKGLRHFKVDSALKIDALRVVNSFLNRSLNDRFSIRCSIVFKNDRFVFENDFFFLKRWATVFYTIVFYKTVVNEGSSITIVNEGSLLTIVNEGLSLSYIQEKSCWGAKRSWYFL